MSPLGTSKAATSPRAHLHPHAADGAAGRTDPARARPRRPGRARRPRPGAGPRRLDRRRPRRRSTRPMPRASSRARSPAPSRPATSTFPPTSASGSKPRCARQALDRLGLEARGGTLINGSEKVETAARQGKVHLLIHAADAGEDGNRKLDQAWRVGGGGRGPGLGFSRGAHHLVDGAGPRECGTYRPDRRRCRKARALTPSTGGKLSLIPMLG